MYRPMVFLLLAIPALVMALGARSVAAAPHQQGGTRTYILPGKDVFPEGVAYQPSTGDFFVGSTTDGTIYRGNVNQGAARPYLRGDKDRPDARGLEVDDQGRLWVAGGPTGKMLVYDTSSGDLISSFSTGKSGMDKTFLNDVTVAPDGTGYVTDSTSPILYRARAGTDGDSSFDAWLKTSGTVLRYQEGFNLNGIVATTDAPYLITVQSNTGKLFRINTDNREVAEVDLGGAMLTNGDGLWLDGHTLYVARNQQGKIVRLTLSEDYSAGTVDSDFADPSLAYPTTIARYGTRLLVVNSQLDKRESGSPKLPFTVSNIRIPSDSAPDGLPDSGAGAMASRDLPIAAILAVLALIAAGAYIVLPPIHQ